MANRIKGLVSKNKRRYQADGFDLDLSYILPRLIAMGFPAEKLQGVFRNHIDDVVRFLELHHKGHYKIYNLCAERSYDKSKFQGPVEDFPFKDHHPPLFEIISQFCDSVQQWLLADANNIAVVHCKAGKGRTGVMICSYLLHSDKCDTADKALKFYSTLRTMDEKGVTIPSQCRYVHYYCHLLRNNLTYKPVALTLHAIKLEPLPACSINALWYVIRWYGEPVWVDGQACKSAKLNFQRSDMADGRRIRRSDDRSQSALLLTLKRPMQLVGDICIEFYQKPKMMTKEKLFHFWFNTFFISNCETCRLADFDAVATDGANGSQSAAAVSSAESSSTVASSAAVDNVLEAHRQRERLHSQVMEGLLQVQQELHHSASASTGSTGHDDVVESSASTNEESRHSCQRVRQDLQEKLSANCGSLLHRPVLFRTLELDKNVLDKAHKDKQHKIYPVDFKVKLFFTSSEDAQPLGANGGSLSSQPDTNLLSPNGVAGGHGSVDSGSAVLLSDVDVDDDDELTEPSDTEDDNDIWTVTTDLQQLQT